MKKAIVTPITSKKPETAAAASSSDKGSIPEALKGYPDAIKIGGHINAFVGEFIIMQKMLEGDISHDIPITANSSLRQHAESISKLIKESPAFTQQNLQESDYAKVVESGFNHYLKGRDDIKLTGRDFKEQVDLFLMPEAQAIKIAIAGVTRSRCVPVRVAGI